MTAGNATFEDLVAVCKNGGLDILKSFFADKDNTGNLLSLTDTSERLPLFNDEVSTAKWNPFNFAVYYGHLEIVQYLIEEMKVHPMMALEVRREKYEVENDLVITTP